MAEINISAISRIIKEKPELIDRLKSGELKLYEVEEPTYALPIAKITP